jgi:D-alanine-D-alanine ligase
MTATSLLPKIAEHAGIDYGSLCEMILEGAALHANVHGSARDRKPSRASGVTFKGKDLGLATETDPSVRKAV